MNIVLCTSGMIPATFGAEGGGRPGKGQVVGKHSRNEMSRMARGALASAFDEESCVARVSRLGGNRESAFPFVEAEGAELGSGSSRSVRRERGAEVFEAKGL